MAQVVADAPKSRRGGGGWGEGGDVAPFHAIGLASA